MAVSVELGIAGPAGGRRRSARDVRQELARELHDRVAQTLTAMIVEMESFKGLDVGREGVIREVTGYQEATREVLSNIRQILYDLRGAEEDDLGANFAAHLRRRLVRFEAQTGIRSTLAVSARWPDRLRTPAAVNLYRLIEEALTNVRRHAAARGVRVGLRVSESGAALVSVRDDGVGMTEIGERLGFGILGMRERVLLLGGELRLEPANPHGTLLVASIPMGRLT